jgi:uncharacterized phage protein gp47/JayE
MDLPTRGDLYSIGRDYVLQRATRIDPAAVDTQGSDANVFIGSASVVAHHVIKQLAYQIEGLMLDTATGDQLDRWAWDRYMEPRKGAAVALVELTFSRATYAYGAITIAAGTIVTTDNQVQYELVVPAAFSATTLVVSGIQARAVQAGKSYQVGRGYLVKFQSPVLDTSITVTNPEPAAGGEDREEDEVFRERLRRFWRAARRGTKEAIAYGATQVPGVVSAQVFEPLDSNGSPSRAVVLYFADSSGVSNAAQRRLISIELEDWRSAGIPVTISLSIPQIVEIKLKLAFAANVDTVSLSETVRGAIIEYVNSLGVNQTLTRGALNAVLLRYTSDGLIQSDTSIATPVGDLIPDQGKTLRTTIANVELT